MSCGDPITRDWLLGTSAGAVCRMLDDSSGSGIETIVDAAHEIADDQDRSMSAWMPAGFSHDGGSRWRSPNGSELAAVDPVGSIRARPA